MEAVGVEAVVEGLSGFLGDMKKMDSAISGLVPGTKLLDGAFGALGNTIDGFVNFALNTLAHALGELVADAVEFVIQKLGELVDATIQAGGEFQTLELRLQTLNFNTLVESGKDYNTATAESIKLTKEQLDWLQKLAVTTPYDAQDIANVFTLARSYGFANDEAQTLTESISNFAAGMGLGNTEIERIIINFGQMVQQGKVTQRELNDLARGSFVPVNDILNSIGSSATGATEDIAKAQDKLNNYQAQMEVLLQRQSEFTDKTKESTKMQLANQIDQLQAKIDATTSSIDQLGSSTQKIKGADVTVEQFIDAFNKLSETRFGGSAEKMAQTFQGATANLKDFVKSLGGMNIVKPVLDVIGGSIANFITSLTDPKRWDKLVKAASDVGAALASIAVTLMSVLMPSGKHAAEGVVNALEGISDWINKHRSDITDWIIGASRWINNVLIPDIKRVVKWLFGTDEQKGAIQKFGDWIQESFIPAIGKAADWVKNVLVPFLKNDLQPVFMALLPLAEALGNVLLKAFGGEPNQSFTDWIHNSLIPGIQSFTDWINANQDTIALWVNRLIVATVELAILVSVIGFAIAAIANIVAAFVDWAVISGDTNKWLLLLGIAAIALGAAILGIASPILIVIGAIAAIILVIKVLMTTFETMKKELAIWVQFFKDLFQVWKDDTVRMIREVRDALANGDWAGAGRAIIDGIARGITDEWDLVVNLMKDLAQAVIDTWKQSFNIKFDITDALGLTTGSSNSTSSAAAPSTVNSNTTNTNNYNLAINSSAATEPIVQDFNMLQSLNFHGR